MSTAIKTAAVRADIPAVPGAVLRSTPWRVQILRTARGNRPAVVGALVVLAVVALAILAPLLSPYDPVEMNLQAPLQPPGLEHLFGTDSYGRDMLARIIYGARVPLVAGFVSVGLALVVGLLVGVIAGYVGGAWDVVLMRAMDGLLTFPPIILAIALVGAFGPSIGSTMLALGIVYAPQVARVIRSTTLSTKEELFVIAAQALGAGHRRVILRYIAPNAIPPIVVLASAMFAYAIIAEATLSFLGLGTQPPTPDWGEMVSSGRSYMDSAYWAVLFPSLAIMAFVIAVNFLGDGIRDLLDPRYRQRFGPGDNRGNNAS